MPIVKKQRWLCLDAQLMHAEKMARGEEAYQAKLLEARQSDWKDEFVCCLYFGSDSCACLGSYK